VNVLGGHGLTSLERYRTSEQERARTDDLVRIVPRGTTVLDIGARDGHFSKLLTEVFETVTALDLQLPSFEQPRVIPVEGNVTHLPFSEGSFDCVFCTEVLEHVRDLRSACSEIIRVAKRHIVIGVPFEQDLRIGRTTCQSCRGINPPWGHVNSFTEERLVRLFAGLKVVSKSFVGTNTEATNPISTFLMDCAGNPWGTYDQEESCIHCGARMTSPPCNRPMWRRACSALAVRINLLQAVTTRMHPNWMHVVFSKLGQ